MLPHTVRKLIPILLLCVGGFLCAGFLLPFLLGGLLALAAEPATAFLSTRLRWRRGAAAGVGVSLTLVLLVGAVSLVGALTVRQLGSLARELPDLQDTARQGMDMLEASVTRLADRAPAGLQPLLQQTTQRIFNADRSLTDRAVGKLPVMADRVLKKLPGGVLGIGTGILSAFMISVRLPQLKAGAGRLMPEQLRTALRRMGSAVGGWLKAQLSLCAVTFTILLLGFWLLGISHGLILAALVAVVDAVPVLGTGIVLLPWALIRLLQNDPAQAIGLAVLYGCAVLSRTVLEPKLVGRQIGLDPLVTLVFLYAGFRIWGVLGMILAPMAAAAAKSLVA